MLAIRHPLLSASFAIATGLSVALAIGQSACAVTAHAPEEVRLLIKPTRPATAGGAIALADLVSSEGRVPRSAVTYIADNGGDWHAVSVQCADPAHCEALVARLRADTTHFAAVERDGRKTAVPRSPSP